MYPQSLPTSMLDYANDFQVSRDRFAKRLVLRELVAELAGELDNVTARDFQLVAPMSEDLDRYKDLEHFELAIAREVQRGMGTDAEATAPARVRQNSEALRRRVLDYSEAFCRREPARCQDAMLQNLARFRAPVSPNPG